jgi:glyoxylase-like metal-dependent hydrolase (beta-lactamase superfamily II)
VVHRGGTLASAAVRKPTRRREVGRGERVVPGVWRLRLPLPWPGVPHCNAWAIAAGDGVVLVDTGMHEPGAMAHLERALDQAGLRVEHVRLVACTHAHVDHCGQAAPVCERAGCELWMHPAHGHLTASLDDPEHAVARRIEVARQSGVPEEPLRRWIERRQASGTGIAGPLRVDRDLVAGVALATDLGEWQVIETPGHAPSHVCLYQPERRLLLSGDHLLGRVSLYFDHGFTPDPVGEFLSSLDAVAGLDARLCLSGHGRPFTDVAAHVAANRALVAERLDAVRAALAERPLTPYELAARVYGEAFDDLTAGWLLSKTLCWLAHLDARGEAARFEPAGDGGAETWRPAGS